jgi:hypothetical protein
MAAELEWIIARPRRMDSMPPLMQTECLQQIAGESRDCVRVQPARYPKMLIKDRFQVSCHDGFWDCMRITLPTARERGLKKGTVQI